MMPAPRGRIWIALWLGLVLTVLAWVVARQTSAVVTAAALERARAERSLLEGRRAEALRRIREAESRAVLVPRAESLGLRLPDDSAIVILQAPDGER